MPRISPVRSYRRVSGAVRRQGFTLMEALVALAILGIAATTLVRVHIGTLRAGAMAHGMEETVLKLGDVATMSLLGMDDRVIVDTLAGDGWKAVVEARPGAGEAGMWKVWSVVSSNHPAPPVPLYLRDRSGAGSGRREEEQRAKGP